MKLLRGYDSSKRGALIEHINIYDLYNPNSKSRARLANFVYTEYNGNLVMLYNTVTGSFIEMQKPEFDYITSTAYSKLFLEGQYKFLIEDFFILPESFDEVPIITEILESNLSKFDDMTPEGKNSYVIFTTLDCNARCFYCYEKGTAAIKMSDKTAADVADFIINRYKTSEDKNKEKNGVKITWFGGEPLYNTSVMDIIASRLTEEKIQFKSNIISNGSLITPEIISKFRSDWNISNIQITIDGTPDVYNKVKNYKDPKLRKSNPFNVLMDNIKLLLSSDIAVTIRLNVGTYNADDLMDLIEILHNEIGNPSNFGVYCHRLFNCVNGVVRSEEDDKALYRKLNQVKMCLHYYGYLRTGHDIKSGFDQGYCMADSAGSLCINPMGKLTLCEHHSDDCIIGDIYTDPDKWDKDEIKSWKKKIVHEKCKNCVLRTICVNLEKCADVNPECTDTVYKYKLDEFKFSLRCLYDSIIDAALLQKGQNNNDMIDTELNRIANELELSNDYKSLTLWERIKLLFGFDVYRDPHKKEQDNFNGKGELQK